MRLPLHASRVHPEVGPEAAWRPVGRRASLLAAGASVLALATGNPIEAAAANVPGVFQFTEENIAINLLEFGADDPAAEFGATVTDANPGGHALAEAFVSCAESATCANPGGVVQWARGTDSASNHISVGGLLAIGADALAEGASATAAGIIQTGLWQIAAAEGTAGNEAEIAGTLAISAAANAAATSGSAVAFAGVGAGISQVATSISLEGIAANRLEVSGSLAVGAEAVAVADVADAAATALVIAGINQQAAGQDLAGAELVNSGDIAVAAEAAASAIAGMAIASASAAGVLQFADARTQQFASTTTSGGDLVGTTTNTPSGPSSAVLDNSGSIAVKAAASASGELDASATAAAFGILQLVSGSSANAAIDNSGAIQVTASVDVEAAGSPRGVVFVSGFSQAATAFAFQTIETIDTGGVLTYQLSSTPAGPAIASLDNAGDIVVAGQVELVAHGTGSTNEGAGVAFVDGFDQYASGNGAEASINNSGSFTVLADVSVDSGNVANAVAIATGIDQFASAYATMVTVVFASGTTTPTSFTATGTAVGPASALFENSGVLTVVAGIDSHGEELAFAGATASGIGQFAAGTEAHVEIDNHGSIVVVGELESSGNMAFGGVAAIGFQQGAQASAAAEALFANDGTVAILASGQAEGEVGAFINATAFAGAQNIQAEEEAAHAAITNGGMIDVRAVAAASAGDTAASDMAIVFAAAHGLGQLAQGQLATVEFDNSGTFQLLADVSATADDFGLGSAIASGVIQQVAVGTASGTGSASIDNSGTILVGAIADVAAGSTALALAGITNVMAQLVTAGELAEAEIVNSGSISLFAEAEALAAGGDVTDIASAQAFVFGLEALASVTGASGSAAVDLSNLGSIDITAVAHATASGFANALASAAFGMAGTAYVAGSEPPTVHLDSQGEPTLVGMAEATDGGAAMVHLDNQGELTLVGKAQATGGYTAHATGIAVGGMDAFAQGNGDAAALLANSGELTLVADAHASAGTNALAVAIAIDGLQMTAHAGIGDALAEVDNSGELAMLANATATALNAQAFAIVGGTFFTGAVFQSAAAMGGNASAIIDNSGSMSVVADALANGAVIATASAVGGPGFNQFAFATSGDAFAGITNSGTLEFVAHGEANATNSAFADALFYNAVGQFANANGGEGQSLLQLSNEGSIAVAAVAQASGEAVAGARAVATHLVGQVAMTIGNNASAALDNSGSIAIDAAAIAEGSIAGASATIATGLIQAASAIGEGEAEVVLDNSGSIDMAVLASAESPDGLASAVARLEIGISQYAGAGSSEYSFGTTEGGMSSASQHVFPTGPTSIALDNSGSIDIAVAAAAQGATSALAHASGQAIEQFSRGLTASVLFANDGDVAIELGASASADGDATATASLLGIGQRAAALETSIHMVATEGGGQVTDSAASPIGTALAVIDNSGSLVIAGLASATAESGAAVAGMAVEGIVQSVSALDASALFDNSGEIAIVARAEAQGGTAASAAATALGYQLTGADEFTVDFSNDGELLVLAEARADAPAGLAAARAAGIEALGSGLLAGTIENGGDLLVKALAEGSDAIAKATGIAVGTNANGLVLTNSGTISVQAQTDGGTSQATAIRLVDDESGGPAHVIVTNDGGTIIARVSEDGGASWSRGMAIDLAAASGSSVLNLVGDGVISGDIDLASGQTISVANGETWFSGLINPECNAIDCGQGILAIGDGGALFLRHSAAGEVPSGAYLEELAVASDGTLIFELPVGANPQSAFPRIVTGVANLDGSLLVRPGLGLYEDSYQFDDVIDADVRNGQFDHCGIDGDPVLLQLSCSYDGQGNVDLGITRVAFDAVSGMTRNQTSVGGGIEAVYDVDLDGPFAEMVGELFTFAADDYRRALDQLAGAAHAAYLQSFNSLGEAQAQLIDRGISCELPGSQVSSLSCRPGKINLWGQIDYANRQSDGDEEAGAYDADRWTALIGADVEVGDEIILGASLAKVGNRLRFHDGGRWNADGYQLGAYGAIDRGSYYAKLIGTIAWFEGDSRRRLDWTGFGGSLAGQMAGDADARLWTLGAHFGYRVAMGGNGLVTPFLNIDHSSARLDGFTETGLAAADLAIDDSTSSRTAVTVGAKWAMEVGGVVPQAELGYRHLFGDRRAKVDAAFAAETGSDFDLVSAPEKRGSLLAGLSLGGRAGPVDLRVGYQGLFDGNATSHSANIRLTMPLGGK